MGVSDVGYDYALGYQCPYCLERHALGALECSAKGTAVPRSYVHAMQEGASVVQMLTIGYSGHGKTCYLASLLHAFYYGDPLRVWPGFSFIGLNQATLDRVRDSYVSTLHKGVLPERTSEFVADSLILQLNRVPLARKAGPVVLGYKPSRLILTLYDIGGEAYSMQETIAERLSLISRLPSLVFLVDLMQMREAASDVGGRGIAQQLHDLLNTVLNALEELGQVRQKGIVVCFTKVDQLRGNPDFGPLAQAPLQSVPDATGMRGYVSAMQARSDAIGDWLRTMYPAFHNTLVEYFSPVAFATVSALGVEPDHRNETVPTVRPTGIADPLLWTLKMGGHL